MCIKYIYCTFVLTKIILIGNTKEKIYEYSFADSGALNLFNEICFVNVLYSFKHKITINKAI